MMEACLDALTQSGKETMLLAGMTENRAISKAYPIFYLPNAIPKHAQRSHTQIGPSLLQFLLCSALALGQNTLYSKSPSAAQLFIYDIATACMCSATGSMLPPATSLNVSEPVLNGLKTGGSSCWELGSSASSCPVTWHGT